MSRINNVKADMGYLGENYQYLLVKYFIETPKFFISLVPIIDQNMFTDEHLRRIVGMMKDRYTKNGVCPNYNDIELIIRTTIADKITVEIMLEKIKQLQDKSFDIDIELLTSNAEKFFKQQNLAKAINQCTEILKRGNADNYFTMEQLIKTALETNTNTDMGFHLFENLEEDLKEDYRCAIPTGADKLDESLYGGLGKGELGIIVSPMGVGKAQPLHSRVLTPDGYKTMGDINVGDYVIGGDGKSHKVIGTYPQGVRPVYRLEFSNGSSCECDIEHLWNVNTYFQRHNKSYIKGSGRKNNKKRFNPDYSFKTVCLRDILNRGLRRKNSKGEEKEYIFYIPNCKPVEFNEQRIDFNPYFLGYYIGDGCFQRCTITVGNQDKEEIYNLLKESIGEDFTASYYKNSNIWCFYIHNDLKKKCCDILGSCNSGEKYIPNEYLFNTVENRIALLQGLMDSDGYVDKRGICQFTTKSKKLADNVYFIVRSLGGNASIKQKKTGYLSKKTNERIDCGIAYNVTISFEDENIIPFRLERKVKRYKPRTRYFNQNKIVKAEYVRDEETKCILVDSDEHLYITEDFIVTHNTSCTTGFCANAAISKTNDNNYMGYKVLHFFFEDTEVAIRRKYYGYVTDIDACDLSDPYYKPKALEILNNNNNELRNMLFQNIICQRLQSGEYSASDIKYLIQQYISRGFKPDLVVIDYFECLKSEKNVDGYNDSEWSREGITMRKLESMANEFDIALWVPVQSTKSAIGQEYVGVENAGGSVKKTQIGHVVIQLAQTQQQKEDHRLSIFIGKLRAVKIGRTSFPNVKFNNGTCKFDMSELDSIDNEPLGSSNSSNKSNEWVSKADKVAKSTR